MCDSAGVTELASVSGDVDLSTSDGRFKARILGSVAAKESDDKSRRIRRKMAELARNGQNGGGGSRPFGFEADRVTIRRSEAKVIRELAERLLAGEALRSLCADLNRREIRTTTGGEWKPNVLKRLLRSARISGQREHKGEIVAKAVWPAIIRPEQTTKIRAIFDDPSRRNLRAPRTYLLKGLLRCGRCGSTLVSRPREDGERRYVCARGPGFAGCGKTYVLAEPVEEFVTEAVLDRARLARAGAAPSAAPRMTPPARGRTAPTRSTRSLTSSGPLRSRRDHDAGMDGCARAASAAAGRGSGGISAEPPTLGRSPGFSAPAANWEAMGELDIERRHAVIAAVLAHVEVGPGRRGYNRFDPDRFGLVWRY